MMTTPAVSVMCAQRDQWSHIHRSSGPAPVSPKSSEMPGACSPAVAKSWRASCTCSARDAPIRTSWGDGATHGRVVLLSPGHRRRCRLSARVGCCRNRSAKPPVADHERHIPLVQHLVNFAHNRNEDANRFHHPRGTPASLISRPGWRKNPAASSRMVPAGAHGSIHGRPCASASARPRVIKPAATSGI